MLTKSNIVGDGEFYFCPGQTSAAAAINRGFKQFGNLSKVSINPVIESTDHNLPRRGINTRGKTHVTKIGLMIQAEMHDVTWNSISTLFGSKAEYGGSLEDGASASAETGESISVPATLPDGIADLTQVWFQLQNTSNVPYTNITAVTLTRGSALVEGTDYELNTRTGQVRFLSSLVALGNTVTVTAVTAGGTATERLQGMLLERRSRKKAWENWPSLEARLMIMTRSSPNSSTRVSFAKF